MALPLNTGASHENDSRYDIPIWFSWGTSNRKLDVLIIPPPHGQIVNGNGLLGGNQTGELTPYENSYLDAIEDSITVWKQAINTWGSSGLKTVLINVYVLGRDLNIPATALSDPEIVITTDVSKGTALGVAVQASPLLCVVDNSRFFVTSMTYEDMYNINGQEFGHCLGLDHVVEGHPLKDVMNGEYPYTPGLTGNPLQCTSNLDVRGLEVVFGFATNTPSVSLPVTSYAGIPVNCGS